MSDLQCAARVCLVAEEPPDEATLVDLLCELRPRAVHGPAHGPGARLARLLADRAAVRLDEWQADAPPPGTASVVLRLRGLADLHRGETVVVVDGAAVRAVAPDPSASSVQVVLDSDGMVVLALPGSQSGPTASQ